MKPENQKALVKGFKQLLSWALVLVVVPLTLAESHAPEIAAAMSEIGNLPLSR